LNTDQYIKEEITIEASQANIKALLLMVPISVILLTPYWMLWKEQFTREYFKSMASFSKEWSGWGTLIALVIIIFGIILHELIHGITWARFAHSGFRSIRFGVLWKELTPYCHCTEPLTIKQYIIGACMPAVVLGIIPALIAFATGNIGFMAFGLFFTVAAAGDFMMVNILKNEKPGDLIQDHPSKIGCYIFRKPEESMS
jgi:hypothetical protein